jgi:hypothetical protein
MLTISRCDAITLREGLRHLARMAERTADNPKANWVSTLLFIGSECEHMLEILKAAEADAKGNE